MKVVIINKSDTTGGAAVVSYRLMEALRQEGIDARMLVAERLSDSPYVTLAASKSLIKYKFLKERLKIFLANGRNRATLFKIDTGEEGLPLWRHPMVKNADAILLNWVNQGMLSLKGVRKILNLGKPVIWTMHDMWCMTGICHHAGGCKHFEIKCGSCPLLRKNAPNFESSPGDVANPDDLSHKIWQQKSSIFSKRNFTKKLAFVAVSNWLKARSQKSSLLSNQRVEVIPNAFRRIDTVPINPPSDKLTVTFGAARLDDPIKGLDVLIKAFKHLAETHPDVAERFQLSLFGDIKNKDLLRDLSIEVNYLGRIPAEEVARILSNSDIVISSSSYETLPGTLVEGQAYGAIPVSFNQGGQSDIIEHLKTGYLADYKKDPEKETTFQEETNTKYSPEKALAEGLIWAAEIADDPQKKMEIKRAMQESVEKKFSYSSVARKYIELIDSLNSIP